MNLLQALEQREKTEVLEIRPQEIKSIKIEFMLKNKLLSFDEYVEARRLNDVHIIFKINDIEVSGTMDRIVIHQLGQRVLKRYYEKKYHDNYVFNTAIEDYEQVLKDWQYNFNEDRINLKSYCESIFFNEDLVLKYYNQGGKFVLYGIVSKSYKNTSQTEFREMLLKALQDNFPSLHIESTRMSNSNNKNFSPVKESFSLNINQLSQHNLDLGITYGLNNGYRAYSLHIHRYSTNKRLFTPITIERMQNALKEVLTTNIANQVQELLERNNFRIEHKQILEIVKDESYLSLSWRNNSHFYSNSQYEDIQKFINKILIKILYYFFFFEHKINLAKHKFYSQEELHKYFQLMRIAQASEQRVINKINELSSINGKTYFNISEGFREIGTFERAVPKETQRFLIEAGSKFIDEEDYLKKALNENKEIFMTGNYSFIDM
jgi:hypothetical protein